MEYAIETNGLEKAYGRYSAVRNLNITVPNGEIFAVLGPNGAGKTTAIKMLLGQIRPTGGRAAVLGQPVGHVATLARIGFLPEKFEFQQYLTVEEFLQFHGALCGMKRSHCLTRIAAVLDRIGLVSSRRKRIGELSRGMQQRVGLGQAILNDPALLILDEPTSALDPMGRRDVRDIILELRGQGTTVLLNSHLLSEVEMTCDRVAIINNGETVVQGAIRDMLAFSSVVDIEVEGMNDAALRAIRQIVTKLKFDRVPITRFKAWVAEEADISEIAAAIVQNGVELRALIPIKQTLEDLYLEAVDAH